MQRDHVRKRKTTLGRWLPFSFYSINLTLWIVTAITAGAWNLLWLVALPLLAAGLYLLRTREKSQ